MKKVKFVVKVRSVSGCVVQIVMPGSSNWDCSGALAGARDSDVDELGDGDDRHSGIKDDARIIIKNFSDFLDLLGGHVDLWGFEANFVGLWHVEKLFLLSIEKDKLISSLLSALFILPGLQHAR